jgi:hypothetical protein
MGKKVTMERAAAIKRLGKILGKDAGYRIDPKAPSPEQRAQAQAELPALIAAKQAAMAARDKRYNELLAGDAEYQRLKAEAKQASEAAAHTSGVRSHRKIMVGVSRGIFFEVKAEGDSWEEIFQKLEERKARVS